MNMSWLKSDRLGTKRRMAKAIAWSVFLGGWCGAGLIGRADVSMPEYQVKALCLYNFAKYVEWPAGSFPDANSPISIGVAGNDAFAETLKTVVKGKAINGRPIAIQTLKPGEEGRKCHIVFVSSSENKRLEEILRPVKSSPVLTVGEGEPFGQAGGIISLVIRSDKVRFDIDLAAASQARLQISSKLLGLADAVRGKPQ